MSATQRSHRRRTRRQLQQWTSPLTEIPEAASSVAAGSARITTTRTSGLSPTRRRSNRSPALSTLADTAAEEPIIVRRRRAGRSAESLSSNLRQLRASMNERRRSMAEDRLRARFAVQEARDLRNQLQSSLQSHFLIQQDYREERPQLFDSSSSYSSLSSASLNSLESFDDDEEMNQFLRAFLDSLMIEERPLD